MSRNKREGKFLGKHKGRKVRYPKPMRNWITVHGVAGATGSCPSSVAHVLRMGIFMVRPAVLY